MMSPAHLLIALANGQTLWMMRGSKHWPQIKQWCEAAVRVLETQLTAVARREMRCDPIPPPPEREDPAGEFVALDRVR